MTHDPRTSALATTTAAALALALSLPAAGQVAVWQNPAGGLWGDAGNWSTGNVPNAAGESAVLPDLGGPYAVTVNPNPSIDQLTIGAAGVTVDIDPARTVTIAGPGGLTNNGVLNVNDGAASTNSRVRFSVDAPINGSGVLRLRSAGDVLDAQLDVAAGVTVTVGENHTIAGYGTVDADGVLVLHGLIRADGPGQVLRINGTVQMSATGRIEGTDGVAIVREGIVTGGAFLGGVEIGRMGTVGGGTVMTGVNGQSAATSGTLAAGGVVNNGEFVINTAGLSGDAQLRTDADSSITGSGTIRLNSMTTDLGDAQLRALDATTMTIGAGQSITGRGEIRADGTIAIDGSLSPGASDAEPGEFEFTGIGQANLAPTSVTAFDIISESAFDVLTTGPSVTLSVDGTIELRLQDGFVPSLGTRFLVIDDADFLTGSFASVDSPVVSGRLFRVVQTAENVEAVWTCPADTNTDGTVDGSDFFAWVAAFGSGDPVADVNLDGTVDSGDFFAWVAAFGQGC